MSGFAAPGVLAAASKLSRCEGEGQSPSPRTPSVVALRTGSKACPSCAPKSLTPRQCGSRDTGGSRPHCPPKNLSHCHDLRGQSFASSSDRRLGVPTLGAMARSCRIGVQLPEVERRVPWPELIGDGTARRVGRVRLALAGRPPALRPRRWGHPRTVGGVDVAGRARRVDRPRRTRSARGVHELPCPGDARQAGGDRRRHLGRAADPRPRRRLERARLPGVRVPVRPSRRAASTRRSRSSARCSRTAAIDFHGEYYRLEDCVLDPPPARPGGPPLMVGSIGDADAATSPCRTSTAWNMWWSQYGNTVDGFARRQRNGSTRPIAAAGRAPGDVEATAAVLIRCPVEIGRQMGDYDADCRRPGRGLTGRYRRPPRGLAAAGCAARPARRRPDHPGDDRARRRGPRRARPAHLISGCTRAARSALVIGGPCGAVASRLVWCLRFADGRHVHCPLRRSALGHL